jgi:Ni,Fe-hydrogenase I small subunit
MAAETAPYGRVTQRPPAVKDVHIVWITAGLGCDGDSVSITAATQPSVEDVVMGAIPGLPNVHLHNPVLAYEVGDDFMKYFNRSFCLSRRGFYSERESQRRRLLGRDGTGPDDRSAYYHQRMDRPPCS